MTQTFDANAPAQADAGLFGLNIHEHDAKVIIIPVPFAATTSYGQGAEAGPQAVFSESHQVDLYDLQTGEPHLMGIHMLSPSRRILALHKSAQAQAKKARQGRLQAQKAVNQASQEVQAYVKATSLVHLRQNKIVGVLGGDHAAPLGHMQAVGEHVGYFSILHIDAHADLRDTFEGFVQSHASIMHNALGIKTLTRLVQVGLRDVCHAEMETVAKSRGRIRSFADCEIKRALYRGKSFASISQKIVKSLSKHVYVSFDIDGLEPSLCPSTGTPVPGGLDFAQACAILAQVVASGRRIVGFDLCEVAPGVGSNAHFDGNVGARVLYKLCGFAGLSHTLLPPRRSRQLV